MKFRWRPKALYLFKPSIQSTLLTSVFLFCASSILILSQSVASADCASYYDSNAETTSPIDRQKDLSSSNIYQYAKPYAQFICDNVETSQKQNCHQLTQKILNQSAACLNSDLSVKELRPLALAFTRHPWVKELIKNNYFKFNSEESLIRQQIWTEFQVLILPTGYLTPVPRSYENPNPDFTKSFSVLELKLLQQGFRTLKRSIIQSVGEKRIQEFSHLWGAGGILARNGVVSVRGQFGEVWSHYSMQLNIVAAITSFSPATLAERIAHENAHSQDRLFGAAKLQLGQSWTGSATASIFQECEIDLGSKEPYDIRLYPCRSKHPIWFNYHPTGYSAFNSAEFYTKMMDLWVRENLNSDIRKKYHCQNQETQNFWKEMELHLIGEVLSNCD